MIDPVRDRYIKELRKALQWLVNIGHHKGKDGESLPGRGEFEKSMRHAEDLLTRPEDGSLMNAEEFWQRTRDFWKEQALQHPADFFVKSSLDQSEKRLKEAKKEGE